MSLTTIILVNIGAASVLVAVVAAAMLAPTLLKRPFAEGHTHRQKAALRHKQRAEAAQQSHAPHGHGHSDLQLHPIQGV